MATTLGNVFKQPNDAITYKIDFNDWLAEMGDTYSSVSASGPDGVTMGTASHSAGFVYVKVSGGTDGEDYLITITFTGAANVKEVEFYVKVRAKP